MLKKIFSNTLAQLVAKFFGAGLTLLTTYYTIRLAGLDLYGDLTRILVLVAVGFTMIDFGLNAEAVRSSKNLSSMKQNLLSVLVARLLLSLLVFITLNLVVYLLPGGYSKEVKSIFWVGSLAIFFQGIYASGNSYFQYSLSYWRSTISVVLGSLFGALITLYYLSYSPTLTHLVLANTLGYLLMSICTLFLIPKFSLVTCHFSLVTSLLRRSLPLGLILVASVLASKIDTIILGIFRASSEVGQYGFAYRIFDVILVLPVFVMNAIYPLTIKDPFSKIIKNTTYSMAIIGCFVAILLWIMAPLVALVKPGLELTISILRALSLSLPLFYITAPLMWGLIGRRKDKSVLFTYLLATILNAVLNLIFIPSYGAIAAALITGITELFILLSLLYSSHETTLKH